MCSLPVQNLTGRDLDGAVASVIGWRLIGERDLVHDGFGMRVLPAFSVSREDCANAARRAIALHGAAPFLSALFEEAGVTGTGPDTFCALLLAEPDVICRAIVKASVADKDQVAK